MTRPRLSARATRTAARAALGGFLFVAFFSFGASTVHAQEADASAPIAMSLPGTQAGTPPEKFLLTREEKQILGFMSLVDLDDGTGTKVETLRLTGVNLQIVNGLGATNGYPTDPDSVDGGLVQTNGLGNLIIGYNELGSPLGDVRTGSHNIVFGRANSYESFGGIVGPLQNRIGAPFASVSGGFRNHVTGNYGSISGGARGLVAARGASISGGRDNTVTGNYSSINGGSNNYTAASATYANIGGGSSNSAWGLASSISGGSTGKVYGAYSSISGGFLNVTGVDAYTLTGPGDFSSVTGGRENQVFGEKSTISGGRYNVVYSDLAVITGGRDNTIGVNGYATMGAWAVIAGGRNNVNTGNRAVISGGANRSVTGTEDWAAGSLFEND